MKSFTQIKFPLKLVNDAQGPMGIVDARGKAVVWFSEVFVPTKGYAWEPQKRPFIEPNAPRGITYWPQRCEMARRIFNLLNEHQPKKRQKKST